MATSRRGPRASRPRDDPRASLLVLALSAFGAVTTEMLPVGLLPEIGWSLRVSESTAGLVVSLYAVMVATLAVPLTSWTRRVPRKRLLLVAMSLYAVSDLVSAVAPSFAILAVGRALGGVTHALFFSVCIGFAARLVPADRTGRALAVAQGGVTVGFVLGVPLATVLGNATSWRAAFGVLAGVLVLAIVLIAAVLPNLAGQDEVVAPTTGRRGPFAAVVGSNMVVYLGHYTLYTYVTVLLLQAGASAAAVGPILLAFGGAGMLALGVSARQLDDRPRGTALVVIALLCAGLAGVGAGFPTLPLVVAGGLVWTGAFGSAAPLFQAAAVRTDATSPELAGAWVNATANVGIGAGAFVGGALLDARGIRTVVWVAAALGVVAAAIVVVARRGFAPRPPGRRTVAVPDAAEADALAGPSAG